LKVLVTGGGGFIGSHLVERLLADGYDVRVLDNFATGRRETLVAFGDDVELIEGDLQSYERAHHAVRGCEIVFHQAALPSVPRSIQDPLTSNATNVVGTLNLLLAARDSDVRRVVFASSSSVYGITSALPKREDMAPLPVSPYAVAKLACEGYCRSFSEVYGLEAVSLRYFNVFGPRQDPLSHYAAVIPRFITAFLRSQPVVVFGDGEQSRDFTYVDNAIDGTLRAADVSEVSGKVFNVACGERITVNALIEELREITGRDVPVEHAPSRPGEVRHSEADITSGRGALGYRPTVSFREGLRRTVAFYESLEPDRMEALLHLERKGAPGQL
jgi:nucleoside-diphosphate-sugar epimerase